MLRPLLLVAFPFAFILGAAGCGADPNQGTSEEPTTASTPLETEATMPAKAAYNVPAPDVASPSRIPKHAHEDLTQPIHQHLLRPVPATACEEPEKCGRPVYNVAQ
jgi:hypothetical protein